MKLNRQQIEEQNLVVQVSDGPLSLGFKVIKFPEEVDTKLGSVKFWVVPSADKKTLLEQRKFTSAVAAQPPDELDLVLQEIKSKHIKVVTTNPFKVIAETGVIGDEEG